MTLSGKKVKLPFGPPTCTMCVLTIPAAALGMAATAVESAMDSDAIIAVGVEADSIIIAPEAVAIIASEAVAIIASEAITGEADCAVAKPARAETSVALEKYILTIL
jgi:hypothetical protein